MSLKLFYLKVQSSDMSFYAISKKNSKGLGSSHPKTSIIFQFVPSSPRLSSFFQNVEVPNFFLPERQPPILMRNRKETHVIYFKQFYILAQRLNKKKILKIDQKSVFLAKYGHYMQSKYQLCLLLNNIYFLQ